MSVCMSYKCLNTIELIFKKELMLTRQMHPKNVRFVSIGILKILVFKYEPYLCNGCHDLIPKAISLMMLLLFMLKDVLTKNHFWNTSKNDTLSTMSNSNFVDKKGVLQFVFNNI